MFFLFQTAQSFGGIGFGIKREVFFLNLEDGYFGCQVNESTDVLQLFELSKLCDGTPNCFLGSDELTKELKCTGKNHKCNNFFSYFYIFSRIFEFSKTHCLILGILQFRNNTSKLSISIFLQFISLKFLELEKKNFTFWLTFYLLLEMEPTILYDYSRQETFCPNM